MYAYVCVGTYHSYKINKTSLFMVDNMYLVPTPANLPRYYIVHNTEHTENSYT